ncbi:hypothetical protein NM688_g2998 [Phlebia brevispora]|uniref:Uncharacterized protein n=1 Tax=Phlebia brevispora TaxID=194682 RepID=A0ACC1T7E3_9APHY|nr:hypothetical protein NM688_g2998 [Phlebia brevispora]
MVYGSSGVQSPTLLCYDASLDMSTTGNDARDPEAPFYPDLEALQKVTIWYEDAQNNTYAFHLVDPYKKLEIWLRNGTYICHYRWDVAIVKILDGRRISWKYDTTREQWYRLAWPEIWEEGSSQQSSSMRNPSSMVLP